MWSTRLAWMRLSVAKWSGGNSPTVCWSMFTSASMTSCRARPRAFCDNPNWFDSDGMVYGFDLIDPENRMLVHAFRFQVFYHADEQTLLVTRGAHVAAEGM